MTKISNLTKFAVLTTSLVSRQFISRRSYYGLYGIGGNPTGRLEELKDIVFPNKDCYFTELKNEITRLKIKEFAPQVQNQKEQIEKLITDSKEQLSEESKTVLDFYLTTLKQEEDIDIKAGKLAAYEIILETKLTSENVKQIRQLQEEINKDQKHLDNLQRTEKSDEAY